MDFKELNRIIDEEDIIPKEVTNELKILDELPSTTTQAALNDWLVAIAERIEKERIIISEIDSSKPATISMYENWVCGEFTQYSYNMFMNTRRKGKK